MLKFKSEDEQGLTLVELLVVIALVGIVAAIALPVLTSVLASASAKADQASATEIAQFQSDWSQAGYVVTGSAAAGYAAADSEGNIVATIGGNGGGQQASGTTYAVGADYGYAFIGSDAMTGMKKVLFYVSDPNVTPSAPITPAFNDALVGKTVTFTFQGGATYSAVVSQGSQWGMAVLTIPDDGTVNSYLVNGGYSSAPITSIYFQ